MAVNWMRESSPTGSLIGIRPVSTAPRVLRVLIVDEEQNTSGGLVSLVRRWGHEVRTAGDLRAALRVSAVQRPDVVLLNFDLPDLNGCRVARRLRRGMANEACLLIAVTGWTDENRRQHSVEAGIDLLLVTPVPPAVVETLLLLECVHVNRSRTASRLETSTVPNSFSEIDRRLNARLPRTFPVRTWRKENVNEN